MFRAPAYPSVETLNVEGANLEIARLEKGRQPAWVVSHLDGAKQMPPWRLNCIGQVFSGECRH